MLVKLYVKERFGSEQDGTGEVWRSGSQHRERSQRAVVKELHYNFEGKAPQRNGFFSSYSSFCCSFDPKSLPALLIAGEQELHMIQDLLTCLRPVRESSPGSFYHELSTLTT